MKYNGEQLKAMADKIDIVDYIGQTEQLHRKGNNYFIKCPFHSGDNTPSLCINPVSNKWHCFGCGAGSSIYDWIMQKNNKTFQEAVEIVCKIVGEEPIQYVESESIAFLKQLKKKNNTKTILVNDRKTLDFAEDYLNKYSDELPQEWLDEDMTEEALRHYNIRIDHNANRIVYPVFDANNNFIGVKGRTRLKAFKELGLSKYINYQKIGTIDYFQGFQQAYSSVISTKSVIIFEGLKSCIKCYGWGIPNTVSSETSALSEGQLQLLVKTGISEVIIGWDADQKVSNIIKDAKINLLRKFTSVSVINNTLGGKNAPVDKGEKVFRDLLERRIKL